MYYKVKQLLYLFTIIGLKTTNSLLFNDILYHNRILLF